MRPWARRLLPLLCAAFLLWAQGPGAALASGSPNTWTTESALSTVRENPAAATSSSDSRTYAIDGDTGGTTYLQTGRAYTPGSNSWASITNDPTKRTSAAAASTSDGKIYVFGGTNASVLGTAAVY